MVGRGMWFFKTDVERGFTSAAVAGSASDLEKELY